MKEPREEGSYKRRRFEENLGRFVSASRFYILQSWKFVPRHPPWHWPLTSFVQPTPLGWCRRDWKETGARWSTPRRWPWRPTSTCPRKIDMSRTHFHVTRPRYLQRMGHGSGKGDERPKDGPNSCISKSQFCRWKGKNHGKVNVETYKSLALVRVTHLSSP